MGTLIYNDQHIDNVTLQDAIDAICYKDNIGTFKEQYGRCLGQLYHKNSCDPARRFEDLYHSIKYVPGMLVIKPSNHHGTIKQYMNDISFITNSVKPEEKAIIVYVGAAPAMGIGGISSLFPNVKFLLIDPDKFNIIDPIRGGKMTTGIVHLHMNNKTKMTRERAKKYIDQMLNGEANIWTINADFNDELVEEIANISGGVFFICDIRTNENNVSETGNIIAPGLIDIVWNSAMQFIWMTKIKPIRSSVKFRYPFYNENIADVLIKTSAEPYASTFKEAKLLGIDFVENIKLKKFTFWNGDIRIQAFHGANSTETRLWTDCSKTKNYGLPDDYEDRMYAYNCIRRCLILHKNLNCIPELGFDCCGDCALLNKMWEEYFEKHGAWLNGESDVKTEVSRMCKLFNCSLKRGDHGHMYKKHTLQGIREAADSYNKSYIDPYYHLLAQCKLDPLIKSTRNKTPKSGSKSPNGRTNNRTPTRYQLTY